MDADLMLRWMTEVGSGSVRDLREKVGWLARTADLSASSFATGQWVRELSSSAHAEVRWDIDRWTIAPPVITRLPAGDGSAVVVGARPKSLREKLEECDVAFSSCASRTQGNNLPAPDTWLIQFDDASALPKIAREAGAVYGGCAAVRLASILLPLSLGNLAAPPSAAADLERLQPDGHFATATPSHDGLYRMRLNNRKVHLYRSRGDWYHCDRSTGTYIFLGTRSTSVLRWRAEKGWGRETIGTLFVDSIAPLPALQARAATLCSGFAPVFNAAAQNHQYGNVPRAVAARIATTLHQNLEVAS